MRWPLLAKHHLVIVSLRTIPNPATRGGLSKCHYFCARYAPLSSHMHMPWTELLHHHHLFLHLRSASQSKSLWTRPSSYLPWSRRCRCCCSWWGWMDGGRSSMPRRVVVVDTALSPRVQKLKWLSASTSAPLGPRVSDENLIHIYKLSI